MGKMFSKKKDSDKCDNSVTVAVINSGTSRDLVMQKCLRRLHVLTALNSIDVRMCYFPRILNRRANSLLRWHLHERHQETVRSLTEGDGLSEVHVTEEDFAFLM